MSPEDYVKALERRFAAMEKERIEAGLPFKYFGLVCDRKKSHTCHQAVQAKSVVELVKLAGGWSIGFQENKDLCPSCLIALQPADAA